MIDLSALNKSIPGDIRHGHTSQSQTDSKTREVDNVIGSIRRISPYPHGRISDNISVLPDRKQALYVSRPAVRSDVRPVGFYGSNKTVETVDSTSTIRSLPIPGRLAKSAVVISHDRPDNCSICAPD